jgi:hypothetical protein
MISLASLRGIAVSEDCAYTACIVVVEAKIPTNATQPVNSTTANKIIVLFFMPDSNQIKT